MTEQTFALVSLCPSGMAVRDTQGNITFNPLSDEQTLTQNVILPALPTTHADAVYLPLENLLTRSFHFPLKHTRYLDAAMLGQELADTAGIEPNDWWFSWRAHKVSNGVSGVAFALPQTLKRIIEETSGWQQTPLYLVDGWERLHYWLQDIPADEHENIAVIDADADGVFFGFFQAGSWKGMSRLNADMHDSEISQTTMQQALWSLQSMGFLAESMPITGRISTTMAEVLPEKGAITLPLAIEEALFPRHIVTLMLAKPIKDKATLLNIRHGKWAHRKESAISPTWHRPIILSAMVCLLWLTFTTIHSYQLETQLETMNADIISAFHRGLPNESVMMDALPQLQQATNQSGNASNSAVSQQLDYLSEVFASQPWQMQEFRMDSKGVTVSGKVKSLDILNNIRQSLEEKVGNTVQIADTDLQGSEVSFRMKW